MGMFKDDAKFDRVFEIVVAALLGLTALLTAFASFQASLYGGNQATKYARGTAMIGEGNSMYIEALQNLNRDMQVYDEINSLRIDLTFAQEHDDELEAERIQWKLDEMMMSNLSEELYAAIEWADEQAAATGEFYSPFEMEGLVDSYYEAANTTYSDGNAMIEDGQRDNSLGDRLNMTTVVYAVVLFLLGIVTSFQSRKIQFAVGCLSVAALIFSTVVMFTVPMLPMW